MTDTDLEARLVALRDLLAERGMDAMLVPRSDEHQSEYVAPADERLRFMSGFSGSAGFAVITAAEAALFTDGRYTLQAGAQLPKGAWTVQHSVTDPVDVWLAERVPTGAKVGFDPRLHRAVAIRQLKETLAKHDLTLAPLDPNPIDQIWTDQPAPPLGKIELFPEEFAGESARAKLTRLAEALTKDGCDGLVVSAPDSLAWLLNIRGSDLEMLPIAFGYALITKSGTATLYMAPEKFDEPVIAGLTASALVKLAAPSAMSFADARGQKIRFDAATATVALIGRAEASGVIVDLGKDPVAAMKARKNPVEIAGTRAAHIRDGAAVTRFLRWFVEDRAKDANEWDASEALAGFRGALNQYRGPSFSTISASGESAALAHYQASETTARPIAEDTVYLCDSGGQYLDGTTDITRVTVAGTPSAEMRMRYTQVLRGHIALLRQRFPKGVDGAQLDSIARQFLWQEGVDFDHGTGHGIGHFLAVHEGPQSISKRGSGVPLEEGMIVSVEPGYYKGGSFGIRIENLAVVRLVTEPPVLADRPLFEFECLTFVPYERALIDTDLLSADEIAWIDEYHQKVSDHLSPRLEGADLAYLATMTAPLSAGSEHKAEP